MNDIIASDGFLTLLHNNQPKKIGEVRIGKYYIPTDKVDVECKLVSFDFDQDGNQDLFFFNCDHLVLHILSEVTYIHRSWLFEYVECGNEINSSDLVNKVVETYTYIEMGFGDEKLKK